MREHCTKDRRDLKINKEGDHSVSKYTSAFLELIRTNKEIMKDLSILRELELPNWYVAAGYVRNYIWDTLHSYPNRTPLNDIDVIYYNPDELDEEIEKKYEQKLERETGISIWSVKNQARMHIRNGDKPYKSIEDAISQWPETVTAVGIRLERDDNISIISPYGLEDLFEYRVRKSPLFKDETYYRSRINKKNWKETWPRLVIS
ncbi:nucleotidyltransferase family protein [Paenibacillus hemerocallicola]|uniref:Nucleotidyltransferase family protein n=2 Tax=Paenibacillus hemerocallicola TaxID=1172614 RepID=A0A5C4T207_9BACL|nr:nucleotidyltransferase family protein [Paenibacillus hemerocallicola]